MNYSDLSKANKDIKMTPIKGKQYAEVKERINAFRRLFPDGFIETEILRIDEKGVLAKATAGFNLVSSEGVFQQKIILGTGHAYEFLAKNKNINSMSMIENCETSAVGRALAMIGIGINAAIASYDEMSSAIYSKSEEKNIEPIPETAAEQKAAGEEFIGFCQKNNIKAALAAKHFGLKGKCPAAQTRAALDDLKSMVELNTIPNEWRMN